MEGNFFITNFWFFSVKMIILKKSLFQGMVLELDQVPTKIDKIFFFSFYHNLHKKMLQNVGSTFFNFFVLRSLKCKKTLYITKSRTKKLKIYFDTI